ncbi:glycosyltransferase [Sphingomonas edaphi]|uniref:Glycosyltransferase family 1 protein n=1 Tax=Sphingomonas edaphi TaxID=2315689 RepID=A0A418PY95_9SPHN|nr:glycosyltransferase [Sphingomonas edaphi]RIX27013.1 glycosyltransferase family 1 protein [Sphingomonas edaphi]
MTEHNRLAMVATDAVSFNVLYQGQLEYLRDSGVRLSLFCGGSAHDRNQLRARNVGRVFYVPMRRKPHPVSDLVSLIWLSLIFLIYRFDAVVYSTPKALLIGSISAFVTRQRGRIAVVHGRAYENSSGKIRRAYLTLDRIAFACSNQVLFVSRSLMLAYKSDDARLIRKARVLGYGSCNGVDLSRFRPPESTQARSQLRAALNLPADAFVILTVGRLTRDKGILDIAQLVERFKSAVGISWVLVGDIEDEDCSPQKSICSNPRLIHVGFSDEIELWFRAADLHLFLSHREGFGNVAIEAAATGLPTFAYDVVGVRDSVISGETGILFPREGGLEPIVNEINSAIGDRVSFEQRFTNARRVVAARFDREIVWKLYKSAYLEPFTQKRLSMHCNSGGKTL